MRPTLRLLVSLLVIWALSTFAVVPASADVIRNERFDEIFVDINTCAGETVLLQGFSHLVVRELADGGLAVHQNLHLTGTGDQGNAYVANTQSSFTATSTTFESTFLSLLISQSSAANQIISVRISSDPDAPPPSFDPICRG